MAHRWTALFALACVDEDVAQEDPCAPIGSEPASVGEVVDRIGALPSPVSLPCFLASLPRPLPFEATSDVYSAQPAVGERSPRIFLRYPELTLTVVPEGPGASLLELGQAEPSGRTVKAEIVFPVASPLDPLAPFDRVAFDDGSGTGCGVCHQDEVEVDDGRFASTWLQPLPSLLVPLSTVALQSEICEPAAADDRCALLRALFDHGEVVHAPFPADLPTIYDPL